MMPSKKPSARAGCSGRVPVPCGVRLSRSAVMTASCMRSDRMRRTFSTAVERCSAMPVSSARSPELNGAAPRCRVTLTCPSTPPRPLSGAAMRLPTPTSRIYAAIAGSLTICSCSGVMDSTSSGSPLRITCAATPWSRGRSAVADTMSCTSDMARGSGSCSPAMCIISLCSLSRVIVHIPPKVSAAMTQKSWARRSTSSPAAATARSTRSSMPFACSLMFVSSKGGALMGLAMGDQSGVHGMTARIVVRPPGANSRLRTPPAALTRSAMPARP